MKAGTLDCDTHTYYGYHNHKVVAWTNENIDKYGLNSKIHRFIINKDIWILPVPLWLRALKTSIFYKAPVEYYRFIYNYIQLYPNAYDDLLKYNPSAKYYNSVARTLIYPCFYNYVFYINSIQKVHSLLSQTESFYIEHFDNLRYAFWDINTHLDLINKKEDIYYLLNHSVTLAVDYWRLREMLKEYVNLPKYPKDLDYYHDKIQVYYCKYIDDIEKQKITLLDKSYQKKCIFKSKIF